MANGDQTGLSTGDGTGLGTGLVPGLGLGLSSGLDPNAAANAAQGAGVAGLPVPGTGAPSLPIPGTDPTSQMVSALQGTPNLQATISTPPIYSSTGTTTPEYLAGGQPGMQTLTPPTTQPAAQPAAAPTVNYVPMSIGPNQVATSAYGSGWNSPNTQVTAGPSGAYVQGGYVYDPQGGMLGQATTQAVGTAQPWQPYGGNPAQFGFGDAGLQPGAMGLQPNPPATA